MPLTDNERANLRIRAFELLEGWGQEGGDGKIKQWDLSQRLKEAAEMVEWAERPPAIPQTDTFHI